LARSSGRDGRGLRWVQLEVRWWLPCPRQGAPRHWPAAKTGPGAAKSAESGMQSGLWGDEFPARPARRTNPACRAVQLWCRKWAQL